MRTNNAKTRNVPGFIFPLVLGAFIAVTYVGFVAIYTVQPTAYIDEIFHIHQAQRYCNGNFLEWDKKITTLPGLYLFSIGLLGPISWISGKQFCDVFCLRFTNLVGAALLLATLHKLLIYLHGNHIDSWKLILASLNLGIFPVLYWFSFLYYTDVISTLLVFIMMLLHIHKAPNFAAMMGIVAVFMRQTNIVWVGFLAGLLIIDASGFHALRAPIQNASDVKKLFRKIRRLSTNPTQFSEYFANVIADSLVYIVVMLAFLVFVFMNGSLVVGDKENHTPTIHMTQILYFFLFFIFFSLPYAIECIRPFITYCKYYPQRVLVFSLISVLIVQTNTLVHPFLLSDNRHYSFYIWNRLYGKWVFFRYLMVPVYVFGGYVLYNFIRGNGLIFKVLYITASCACLIPQRHIEPRYFIVPFIMARLQNLSHKWSIICFETFYYIFINAVTFYIFISKTFYWPELDEPQRIMW